MKQVTGWNPTITHLAFAWVAGLCLLTGGAEARAEGARVALLPVVVHAADQQDYLRKGLGDMLAARLGQQRGITVVRIDDPAQATTELTSAVAAGGSARVEYVVFGSFTRFGEGASLDLQCAKLGASGVHELFVQAGTLAEIIPKLDVVAQRVAAYVMNGPSAPPAVASGTAARPPADASRAEIDELKRRVTALEQAAGGPVGGGTGPTTHRFDPDEVAPGDEAASAD